MACLTLGETEALSQDLPKVTHPARHEPGLGPQPRQVASRAHLTLHPSGHRGSERWAPDPEGLEKGAGAKRTWALGQGRASSRTKGRPLGCGDKGAGAGPPEMGTVDFFWSLVGQHEQMKTWRGASFVSVISCSAQDCRERKTRRRWGGREMGRQSLMLQQRWREGDSHQEGVFWPHSAPTNSSLLPTTEIAMMFRALGVHKAQFTHVLPLS